MDLSSRDNLSSANIIFQKRDLPVCPRQESIIPELLRDFQEILRRGWIHCTMFGGSANPGDGIATGRSR